MSVESAILLRYGESAQAKQESLCCPVAYDNRLLKLLPQVIIDKDFGCGDPSRYVQQGDVVLDLGSDSGKICCMTAQLVGKTGHVIGIDINDDMLALARKYQAEMAGKLGGDDETILNIYSRCDLSPRVDPGLPVEYQSFNN